MTDLRFILDLCEICRQLASIISAMALRLSELGNFSFLDELEEADKNYRRILGEGSIPWKQ